VRLEDDPKLQKETVKVTSKANIIIHLNIDGCILDGGIIPHVLSMSMHSWSLG